MRPPLLFLGPSARGTDITAILDAEIRPPVGQGDVFKAVRDGATCIAIIDGYFNSTAAVLHKEILWAIDRGIAVFGAASMGALRAAELHSFGMQGVGWVFEAFVSGCLEDDDEVAIIHAPAQLGFVAVSEAMVNIRRTLSQAAIDGVLDGDHIGILAAVAKRLPYADRAWPRILRLASDQLTSARVAAFSAWLPTGRIDIKRQDALALARILSNPAARQTPATNAYEPTNLVEKVRRAAWVGGTTPAIGEQDNLLIRAWRTDDPTWRIQELIALIDALTFEREIHAGATLDERSLIERIEQFRRTIDVADEVDVAVWLQVHGLCESELLSLLAGDVRLLQARQRLAPLVAKSLVRRIRLRFETTRLPAVVSDEPGEIPDEEQSILDWLGKDGLGKDGLGKKLEACPER